MLKELSSEFVNTCSCSILFVAKGSHSVAAAVINLNVCRDVYHLKVGAVIIRPLTP